jgi:hypothetical protein
MNAHRPARGRKLHHSVRQPADQSGIFNVKLEMETLLSGKNTKIFSSIITV